MVIVFFVGELMVSQLDSVIYKIALEYRSKLGEKEHQKHQRKALVLRNNCASIKLKN